MIRISSGEVIRKIQQEHYTTKDLLEYFQMTEDTLKSNMKSSLNPKTYNALLRDLKKNDKQGQKSNKYAQKQHIEIHLPEKATENCESKKVEKEILSPIQITKNKIEDISRDLENIKNKCLEYGASISKYENSITENDARISLLNSEISNLESKNEELSRLIEKITQDKKQQLDLYEEKRYKLVELQSEIKHLETIIIFFHSNGEIEIEDPASSEKTNISFAGNQAILDSLLVYSDLEDFTLKVLKSFASLIGYTKKIKSSGKNFEIAFDEKTFEKVFEEIIK